MLICFLKDPRVNPEKYITLPDPSLIDIPEIRILIDPDKNRHITIVRPTIKKFKLRVPSQTVPGDYLSLYCDLFVKGEIQLGDGNFDKLTFEDPRNAFIGMVEDTVAVEIKNLHLEYQDSSKSVPEKDEPAKPLTADQRLLLDLEKALKTAKDKLDRTPQFLHYNRDVIENPEYVQAQKAVVAAQSVYQGQKAKIIGRR